jgi:hypothetical protein
MSSSDRILAACCPESTIDVFKHAALITALVAKAKEKR